MQRIIDEIANLQKLKHQNIIRYYGVEVHRVRVGRWVGAECAWPL